MAGHQEQGLPHPLFFRQELQNFACLAVKFTQDLLGCLKRQLRRWLHKLHSLKFRGFLLEAANVLLYTKIRL